MLIDELITTIENTTDPKKLTEAVDRFFGFFMFIQTRCGGDVHAADEQIDALLALFPNDKEKLKLVFEKIDPLAYHNNKHNVFCASLSTACEGKQMMMEPAYQEPCREVVHIGDVAAEIIKRHNINHETILSKQLLKQLRAEIEGTCIVRTQDNLAYHYLSDNSKDYLLDQIIGRIKGDHLTMRIVHRYPNPEEVKLFTLLQLTESLHRQIDVELTKLITKYSSESTLEKLRESAYNNKTSLLDEIKNLNPSQFPRHEKKISVLVGKLNAVDDLRKSIFDNDDPVDVVRDYQQHFDNAKPLLMKNADPITKRLIDWIGRVLSIKSWQNSQLNTYNALDKYVSQHRLFTPTSHLPQQVKIQEIQSPRNKK